MWASFKSEAERVIHKIKEKKTTTKKKKQERNQFKFSKRTHKKQYVELLLMC